MTKLSFEVAVVGGGSAGIAAAVSAARRGMRVALIEQYGFCGGMSAASSIHVMDGMLAHHDDKELAVAGIARELIDRLDRIEGLGCSDNPPECLCIDPEALKKVADEMLLEAGVQPYYHTRLVDVESANGMVSTAVLHNKGGFQGLRADYFIDATGDADLCAGAGAEFEVAGSLQPMTLHFRVHVPRGQKNWKELEDLCNRSLTAAFKKGLIRRFGGPWIIRVRKNEVSLNCTRLYGNALSPLDLTSAEIEGRQDIWKIWQILRHEVPDFADSRILCSGPAVMVRETRRVRGEYVLGAEDLLRGKRFPDPVGLGAWPIDIHPDNGDIGYHPHKEHTPPPYQIPYRCLLPLKLENVLITGRAISATREAHGSTRVQGTAMMTGQAAGLACVVAKASGLPLKRIPYPMLEKELRAGGVILDPDHLLPVPPHWHNVDKTETNMAMAES